MTRLASEGGTGDSSECSDVAVGDEDNLEGDSQEAQRAKDILCEMEYSRYPGLDLFTHVTQCP